jgi:transcriptional regulator
VYIEKRYEETRVEVLHALIRDHPLATLVTLSADGLDANHIPMVISESPAPFGTLRGHIARANPLLNDIAAGSEAMAVFHGPQTYISPSWYVTKAETGKVAPTWNYAVVHAHGPLRVVEDAAWIRTQLEALTAHNEASFPEPWAVADAPDDFVEQLIGAIIGFEMPIERLYGKWKVSQNQPPRNQASVIEALRASGHPHATDMALLVGAAAKKPQG